VRNPNTEGCEEDAGGNNRYSCWEVNISPRVGNVVLRASVDVTDCPKKCDCGTDGARRGRGAQDRSIKVNECWDHDVRATNAGNSCHHSADRGKQGAQEATG
ncbi:uncharacterized protein METZ01_LOCUS13104, partial [marine metagenome]